MVGIFKLAQERRTDAQQVLLASETRKAWNRTDLPSDEVTAVESLPILVTATTQLHLSSHQRHPPQLLRLTLFPHRQSHLTRTDYANGALRWHEVIALRNDVSFKRRNTIIARPVFNYAAWVSSVTSLQRPALLSVTNYYRMKLC